MIFKEKITSTKVISIFLVIIWCILTTGLIEGNYGNISAMGILGGVIAAIFWAPYAVTSKKALEKETHSYTILFYSLIIITLILLPLTNFGQISEFVNSDFTFNIIFLILHSALSFALPSILLLISLKYIDSGNVSIFTSGAEPLAALFFGIIAYNEQPTVLTFRYSFNNPHINPNIKKRNLIWIKINI